MSAVSRARDVPGGRRVVRVPWTLRVRAGVVALLLVPTFSLGPSPQASAEPADTPAATRPGGATTLEPGRKPGLASAFTNLSLDERFELGVGRGLFRDPWIAAPATTIARDGLGPLFNAHSCLSCHPDGGRGALAPDGAASTAVLLRLLRDTRDGVAGDPVYGDQLQTRSIATGPADGSADERVVAEGDVAVMYETVTGRFADGTPYELRRPTWRVVGERYGPLHADTRLVARLAPSVHGTGLLDAIPAEAIVARADPDDRDGDGISGRPSLIAAARGARTSDVSPAPERRLGRFGWKATQPTLREQVAAALHRDLGITSEVYPSQPCTPAQRACLDAPDGGDPPAGTEISPRLLDELTRFTGTLAVAARSRAAVERTTAGAQTFQQLGCAACHTPSFVTGDSASVPGAARQTIWPYSDLLLHDLGPELADPVGEGDASGAEWRTAPLWGLGRATRDRARTSLLHDGRARTVTEAILWHGGEGRAARDAFLALPRAERDALLDFLETL